MKAIDQWQLTTLESLGTCMVHAISCPAHVQAHFLTSQDIGHRLIDPLSNRAGQLIWPAFCFCARPPGFKSGRLVYNLVEQLTNGSTVNNRAVTHSYMVITFTFSVLHTDIWKWGNCTGNLLWWKECSHQWPCYQHRLWTWVDDGGLCSHWHHWGTLEPSCDVCHGFARKDLLD